MAVAPAFILGRCNPYGAETGGPKHVMGGLHGPNSARVDTPDVPGLPEAVVQGEWACHQPAQVRVRMVCRCGHTGAVMDLCSWHDEPGGHSEFVAGVTRWVSEPVRVRGHYEEISRRQAGACIRCLFPGEYAANGTNPCSRGRKSSRSCGTGDSGTETGPCRSGRNWRTSWLSSTRATRRGRSTAAP